VSKNAEFNADFESVEKVLKKFIKQSYFTFTHVRQTCFAYNFILAHSQLFQRIRNQREILRFLTPFRFFAKNFFLGHISTFFKL
jgi:hypothetical protein